MEPILNHSMQIQQDSSAGYLESYLSNDEIIGFFEGIVDEIKDPLKRIKLGKFTQILIGLSGFTGKKSFLVYKKNRYVNVLTETIAYFYIKYETAIITCFDGQEYFVNYSLDKIQQLLPEKQFFRLNRQYLINFSAVKEVEHYFARKLLVIPVTPAREKLVVPKEKVTKFLQWLDNR